VEKRESGSEGDARPILVYTPIYDIHMHSYVRVCVCVCARGFCMRVCVRACMCWQSAFRHILEYACTIVECLTTKQDEYTYLQWTATTLLSLACKNWCMCTHAGSSNSMAGGLWSCKKQTSIQHQHAIKCCSVLQCVAVC